MGESSDPQSPAPFTAAEELRGAASPGDVSPGDGAVRGRRLVDPVAGAVAEVAALLAGAVSGVRVGLLADAALVELLGAVEGLGRLVDGLRVVAAADVERRSERVLAHESLAWKLGCSSGIDVITRKTRVSVREARRRVRVGQKVLPRQVGPAVLPPWFPAVAEGLASGVLGVDAAEGIIAGLEPCTVGVRSLSIDAGEVLAAERALVAVRGMALQWQARLDPDGAAPDDRLGEKRSSISFGLFRDGLYPLRGGVTPEFRAVVNNLVNTYLSSHATPAFPSEEEQALIQSGELVPGAEDTGLGGVDVHHDDRTGGEKRADLLHAVLEAATRDPGTPKMGGAAPTVLLHVNAHDLEAGHGVGWIDGVDAPVSLRTVHRMLCAGGSQTVIFGPHGEVLRLGLRQRFFTPGQRRAIGARDEGCIIPGCTMPLAWTEVHHVVPWQHKGPTNVDNGVLLCRAHHHSIDTSGWLIRMVRGRPEVKAPPWLDTSGPGGSGQWRPAGGHRAHPGIRTRATRPVRASDPSTTTL
jgi:hypothetical protein